MSYQNLLNFIADEKPLLHGKYAVLSAPVRHLFMMAAVWFLAKKKTDIPLNIMEIGSWQGASALTWAQGLTEHTTKRGSLTCVDAWEPFFSENKDAKDVHLKMNTVLTDDVAYSIFKYNMDTIDKSVVTQHLRGKSENILPILKPSSFNIIFVDADHTYSKVKQDLLLSMPLLKEGGILCGDDLNLQLSQVNSAVAETHKESDLLRDEKTGRNYHPGVTVAVNELLGKVSSWGGFWAMEKISTGWQEISLKDFPVIYPNHFTEKHKEDAANHLADIEVK